MWVEVPDRSLPESAVPGPAVVARHAHGQGTGGQGGGHPGISGSDMTARVGRVSGARAGPRRPGLGQGPESRDGSIPAGTIGTGYHGP